ncbi:hypothetical protein ACHAPI_012013 [Fusarium lateritium]
MDPFARLPSLIQTEILVQLETESSIAQLIQASASLRRHFFTYEKSILRRIVDRLLEGDTSGHLLRDALGIIYISDATTAKVFHHEKLWHTREVSDPIGLADLQMLFSLFSRVIVMIEDYATKATSIYPPRDYLGLPDLVFNTGADFKGKQLNTNNLGFSSLSLDERIRFLRAFLRHELFCRTYRPSYWLDIELDDQEDLCARYGGSESPSLNDLGSVDAYYESVYGALFAQCQDSWLPNIPDQSVGQAMVEHAKFKDRGDRVKPTSQDHGLLFPDNMFFDAKSYLEDLNYHCALQHGDLTLFGLDFLMQLIRFLRRNPDHGKVISKWLERYPAKGNGRRLSWMSRLHQTPASDQSYPFPDPDEGQMMGGSLHGNLAYLDGGARRHKRRGSLSLSRREWRRLRGLQRSILEQRAWGLFDNRRFYPPGQHFPSLDDIYQLHKQQAERFLAPNLERSRRRSQKWHDHKTGKRLDPPLESEDDECVLASIEGHLGPSTRFFDTSPGTKLPMM